MSRLLLLLSLLGLPASAQLQRGRIAVDAYNSNVLFETTGSLIGETTAAVERIMEFGRGTVTITATSPPAPPLGGVMGPRINDNGDLRAYSFYELRYNGRN